jgi:hypothetical protein
MQLIASTIAELNFLNKELFSNWPPDGLPGGL